MRFSRQELLVLLNENLLKENLDAVVQEIQEMQAGRGMVAANHEDAHLQGDVYGGVPCVTRSGGQVALSARRVMLISNSCDASPDNPRPVPLGLTVAPLLRLSRYAQILLDSGVRESSVSAILDSIRTQTKTNLLYVPAGAHLEEEMVALLDQVQSVPAEDFLSAQPSRLAVLTQRGFWVLLMKLSMHFLRPHEGVERAAA